MAPNEHTFSPVLGQDVVVLQHDHLGTSAVPAQVSALDERLVHTDVGLRFHRWSSSCPGALDGVDMVPRRYLVAEQDPRAVRAAAARADRDDRMAFARAGSVAVVATDRDLTAADQLAILVPAREALDRVIARLSGGSAD